MQDLTLDGFRYTDDDVPLFVYDATMSDGPDTDGTFQVAFAAGYNDDDELRFLVARDNGDVVADWPNTEEVRTLVRRLAEKAEFYAGINYENKSYETGLTGESLIIMGRDTGGEFDVKEHHNLGESDLRAVEEILEVLEADADA